MNNLAYKVKRNIKISALIYLMTITVATKLNVKYICTISTCVEIIYIVYLISKFKIDSLKTTAEQNHQRYRMAIDAAESAVWEWDEFTKELFISSRMKKVFNVEEDIDSLEKLNEFLSEEDREKIHILIFDIINNRKEKEFDTEINILARGGSIYAIEVRGSSKVINGVLSITGIAIDITESKRKDEEKESKINFMNYYDETTGIPNRRYFTENVGTILKKSKELNEEVAIVFIDLDNFKYVNDTYGHQVGDKLLSEFSRLLNKQLNSNSILARFGGDEFVMALRNMGEYKDITNFLKNLVKNFNDPLKIEDRDMFCSVSVGVSLLSRDGDTVEVLLKKADMAMYKAKSLGKNQYKLFDEGILKTIERELAIREGLRNAIYNEEIFLLLQPKVRVSDESVIGYECLARWNSSSLGFVSPAEFISVAENCGLISDLGKFIIREAFSKCKELTNILENKFTVAINLSEVQLREEDIVDFIEEQLKSYDLDSSYIEFEITESVIMQSAKKNIDKLLALKKLGFSIALDDFGTGYSSLNYLKILPIDVLKIDKSFIDDVCKDSKSEFIIEKIIELSHNFNLQVIAEGVETREQLEYLKNRGCDIVQGYYFSKPLEFEKIKNNSYMVHN